jgi:phage shock protein E
MPVETVPSRLAEIEALVGNDRSKPIVVYCAAGGRATRAKTALEAACFAKVVNGGGYRDLK